MLLCSVVMGVGTSVGGEKIIKSVGMDMVKLEKYQGFSADLSSSLCILLATLTGIPVSTTHVKTSAIMGVGAVKRLSAINFGVVKNMMLTWVFTFRAAASSVRDGKAVPAVPVNAWAPPWRKESERTDHGKEKRLVLLG